MGSTAKGVPYPELTDAPNGPADIKALADFVDAVPGIAILNYAQIEALSGFALWTGRCVYQTDGGTKRPFAGPYWYGGAAWRPSWTSAWGHINEVTPASDDVASGTFADVNGGAITFTAVGNRVYKLHAEAQGASTVDQDLGELQIFDDDVGARRLLRLAADHQLSVDDEGSIEVRTAYPAGSHTVKLQMRRANGSGTFTFSNLLLAIEDIGPAGAPA